MFAAIVIPDFALQAVLRHEPAGASLNVERSTTVPAIALVDPALPKPNIIQLTAAARAHGVVEGLTASQAMARCGELIIKSRSPAQEEAATEVLLQTAGAFSPNLESTAPGVCTLELKGLRIAWDNGGAEAWAEKIRRALAQFHLDARIGFGPTPELAQLAARAGSPVLSFESAKRRDGETATSPVRRFADSPSQQLQQLPLTALDPPPELLDILQRWGIQTIGGLLALGKDRVAERLGPAAIQLFDRVSTDTVRPLKLVAPPGTFAEQMDFEHEIETMEPLLFVLRRFVEQLARRVELLYLVIAEFHLRLGLASGGRHERVFQIPAPTSRVETLFRMLHTHLETVRTDSPIVSVRLGARPCRAAAHQFGLFETTLRDPNQFAQTLAQLTALCGSDRVGTPQPEATHRPDAFKVGQAFPSASAEHRTSNFELRTSNAAPALRARTQPAGPAAHSAFEVRRSKFDVPGLPLRRFRPAIAAHVEFRAERPALLRSPMFTGAIAEARGPFLSSGNWWEPARWAREEWDIQTADGALYRIFRSADGCFVEGEYD